MDDAFFGCSGDFVFGLAILYNRVAVFYAAGGFFAGVAADEIFAAQDIADGRREVIPVFFRRRKEYAGYFRGSFAGRTGAFLGMRGFLAGKADGACS